MRFKRLQAGDTIVEVLIAMTVTATILGSSYTVVNRTMANARQAQEHAEALQLANKQIEYIVSLAGADDTQGLYASTPLYKCVDKTNGTLVPQPLLQDLADARDKYAAGCRSDSSAGYLSAFTYNNTGKYFRVYVTWPSVTGNGNDQVSLTYRAYRP